VAGSAGSKEFHMDANEKNEVNMVETEVSVAKPSRHLRRALAAVRRRAI
jgi:hypothetical protein